MIFTYSYDAENRLLKTCGSGGVGVEYTYNSNGNLLEEAGAAKTASYEYNPQNRMVRSRVVDDEARTIASTRYGYDPLGRRALVQDNNAATLRTLYDSLGFDVVKESPVYANGGFTDTYNIGIQYEPAGRATGERYRYLDDGQGTGEKYQYIEDNAYQTVSNRYAGERTMLYVHGSPVAINRSSGTRGYLGTDILGSTRSVTDSHGVQESYYDYDIFGSPVAGDFTTGADYGYLGKPYDSITGLYNYGYRDYSPQSVRFTTVDPIRDGANWFAYVNNDPVNYVDLWGLLASENDKITNAINTVKSTQFGKSEDGQKVVEHLSKMNEGGKITIEKLEKGVRAQVGIKSTGEVVYIKISQDIPESAIPGRLVHEGTHIINHENGIQSSLDDEKIAFQNAYSVDKELKSPIQDMPSDEELEERYSDLNWLKKEEK